MATKPASTDKNKAAAKGASKEAAGFVAFLRNDFPTIRNASIVFLLCLAIGAGLIISSQTLLASKQDAIVQGQAVKNQAREKYNQVNNEKREIQDFQPKYVQLTAQGFVGTEQRLDWIEQIQRIQKQALLQPINYEIAQQHPFQVDPAIDMGTLELRGSKMVVKMNLLHELDLFNFLDGLNSNQAYDLQNCTLKRLADSGSTKLTPLLSAECSLYWITIGKAGGDGVPG